MIKRIIKKFKFVNLAFEYFILFSNYFFLPFSKLLATFSKSKLLRRIIFNMYPRNKELLLNTDYGKFIINTNSRIIAKKSYLNNIPYSAMTVQKVLKILEKENITIENFIDIGANIGTTSISASFLNAKINFLCIEGNFDNYESLKRNIKLNNLERRFDQINEIIGEKKYSRYFVDFVEEGGCSRVFDDLDELNKYKKEYSFKVRSLREVKTKPLDDILKNFKNTNLMLWIDIEGLDLEILQSNITKKCNPVFFEFNPTFYKLKFDNYEEYISNAEDYLIRCGYKFYFVENKNLKKEKIRKNFLIDEIKYLGKNKSSTNLLII